MNDGENSTLMVWVKCRIISTVGKLLNTSTDFTEILPISCFLYFQVLNLNLPWTHRPKIWIIKKKCIFYCGVEIKQKSKHPHSSLCHSGSLTQHILTVQPIYAQMVRTAWVRLTLWGSWKHGHQLLLRTVQRFRHQQLTQLKQQRATLQ